ncbi:MAG: class I SAM-dependent RNA methyltransferase [Oscillospiraceae bacterium]|nr:class I SAM-dependent RNA methyltransferase [Oscillospiraceae bacterium]
MNNGERLTLTCPCHFGTERTLKFEVSRIGGENITVSDGRLNVEGTTETIARANICLASAERVQILLGTFRATTFDELFEGVKALPLERFIGKSDAFPVTGHSVNSVLHSIPAYQSIIKKAAVDRLASKYHLSFFEETGSLHRIQFNIIKDIASVYIDTSGVGLHKRGYRPHSNIAPIKETLAAGIVDIAGVRRGSKVYDPCCGSGTLLIEAAYKALNIAPGLKRGFAAMTWDIIPQSVWKEERQRALAQIIRDSDFEAFGSDIDPACVELTLENAARAGVKSRIRAVQADIKDFENKPDSLVIANPPYGERLFDVRQAEELYTVMGKVFKADREHPCAVISPDEGFPKLFGKEPDKKRKLYNGMIKCDLYLYGIK